ncbi:MAG: helix-turn-helix domain-containing protein [Sulfitobacter litoralis]|nr:helix-turn-helix domain-containing protein [Sulfitobacter litoralis]
MSHKVTTLVYSRKAGSATRKAVLAYMADRASDDGSGVWASKQTIADEIECGRSTVIRVCNEFVADGILVPTGTRKCANGATVEYALILEAIARLPKIERRGKGSQSGTSPDVDQSHSGTPLVPQRDPKASQSGTQTILEPSMNQDTPLVPKEETQVQPDKPPPKQSRAVSIPSDWVPNDENISHAISKNLTHEEIQNEADQFRDYHLAKGTRFKDWNAGWRTWVGNSIKFRNRGMAGKQGPRGYGQGGSIASAVARRRSGG